MADFRNRLTHKRIDCRAEKSCTKATKIFTDRTLIRSEEGPKGLAAPPTAYMAQAILSLSVVVDTLGGYNWRHHGDI